MSDQDEMQSPYLTSQANPEKLLEPIFYKNRFNKLHQLKNKRSSHQVQGNATKNKNNQSQKDQAFRKTTSCISNIQKYEFGGDLCHNSTYDTSHMRSNGMKKESESKSVENKFMLMTEQEQILFKKMTIHCVRAEREAYQNHCQHLERQYQYILNKMQKERKTKFFSELKDKKLQKLKQERRRLSQDIKKERSICLQEQLNHQKSAKNVIIAQRVSKKLSIQKKKRQNMQSASRQRLYQQEVHIHLQNSMLDELRKKKKLYQKQKQAEEERKHNLAKNKQLRRLQAKKQFRNKWLNQFERSNNAKLKFKQKKQKMENNLKKALQNFLQNSRRLKT